MSPALSKGGHLRVGMEDVLTMAAGGEQPPAVERVVELDASRSAPR